MKYHQGKDTTSASSLVLELDFRPLLSRWTGLTRDALKSAFNFRFAALVTSLVVGCSEPVKVVTVPAGGSVEIVLEPTAISTPTQSTPTLPAGQPALPITKQAILDKIKPRGFTVEPFGIAKHDDKVSGYLIKGLAAGVAFHERNGKLLMVEAMTMHNQSGMNTAIVLGFAEFIGEVVTGLPREAVRRVIGQTMADVGGSTGGLYRTIGTGSQRFKIDVVRQRDGGWVFAFSMEISASP